MDNAFKGSGGLKNRRSFKKKDDGAKISASLGVRLGYVADVEQPPPPGVPPRRQSKRVPTSLRVWHDGAWTRVAGDVSAGGALLLMPQEIAQDEIEVLIELEGEETGWQLRSEVLRREPRGRRVAHHIRFVHPAQATGLAEAIQRAIESGEARLPTK